MAQSASSPSTGAQGAPTVKTKPPKAKPAAAPSANASPPALDADAATAATAAQPIPMETMAASAPTASVVTSAEAVILQDHLCGITIPASLRLC